jgi:hypothetical protein
LACIRVLNRHLLSLGHIPSYSLGQAHVLGQLATGYGPITGTGHAQPRHWGLNGGINRIKETLVILARQHGTDEKRWGNVPPSELGHKKFCAMGVMAHIVNPNSLVPLPNVHAARHLLTTTGMDALGINGYPRCNGLTSQRNVMRGYLTEFHRHRYCAGPLVEPMLTIAGVRTSK